MNGPVINQIGRWPDVYCAGIYFVLQPQWLALSGTPSSFLKCQFWLQNLCLQNDTTESVFAGIRPADALIFSPMGPILTFFWGCIVFNALCK